MRFRARNAHVKVTQNFAKDLSFPTYPLQKRLLLRRNCLFSPAAAMIQPLFTTWDPTRTPRPDTAKSKIPFSFISVLNFSYLPPRLGYSVPTQPNRKFRFHSSLSSTFRTCRCTLDTPSRHSQIENSVFIRLCPQLFILAVAPWILRPGRIKLKFASAPDFSYFGCALDTSVSA